MKSPRLVYVEWIDATVESGWAEKLDLKTHFVKSVGWLMDETKNELILAADYSPPETNRRIAIPLGWIKNKRYFSP